MKADRNIKPGTEAQHRGTQLPVRPGGQSLAAADAATQKAALDYHAAPIAGKIAIVPTKPVGTRAELALAYTPGVAAACLAIAADPAQASRLTIRSNLVAVITNGTAVLGLGDIGALAAKPVMEGKAVLFKRLANLDSIDIEVDTRDPARFIDVVSALEPSFGGINLEDISAPDCFAIEAALKARMNIPVMHDDQHGTAVVVAAGITSALHVTGRTIADAKLVVFGAGASAIACLDLLVTMGLDKAHIWMVDRSGIVRRGRNDLAPHKARYAQADDSGDLAEVMSGADIVLGLSGPGSVDPNLLALMAPRPIVFALANPTPEIMPEIILAKRPDAIVATGRSDYPNQVNNALCFPFIFRGALDCGAKTINEAMKVACVEALSVLARTAEPGPEQPAFGPDYLIPDVLDPRLLPALASAVAEAAAATGVAVRPIMDLDAYRARLQAR